MSEENTENIVDITPNTTQEEAPQGDAAQTDEKQEGIEVQYGFVVGVRKDGGVMLDMIGEKKGLIEMLGLCKYAEYHLNYTLDAASGQGSPVISQQIHQLAEMMKVLLNVIAGKKQQQDESRIVTP